MPICTYTLLSTEYNGFTGLPVLWCQALPSPPGGMRLSRGFGRLDYSAFRIETLNVGGVVKASDWRTRGLAGR
ncbi:hypothetical protein OIDMADRAFT_17032 [Oidiodendron maius Zn]|uniref:Uncharacterized protein n=1 Tax=Oidiodendron maius (strain Zn) TaxID=913774 RepID=A0A0C3HS57_OIDMZ|nr:hypothetical protein OIDMADRAFT_17032 [Oidiodendron maius Zn]